MLGDVGDVGGGSMESGDGPYVGADGPYVGVNEVVGG
jgi:hypothetical protein